MNRQLAGLFVAVQALDWLTYSQMPALEANPVMRALGPAAAGIAKAGAVLLCLAIASRIHRPALRDFALGCGIAVGALGVGANVASLSMVNAAEAPRPAVRPAPMPRGTGYEKGVVPSPVTGPRTAAPAGGAAGTSPTPAVTVADRPPVARDPLRGLASVPAPSARPRADRAGGRILARGTATWYDYVPGGAAAGPSLRRALGPAWRGTRVTVCARRCVRVVLSDWMRADRLVDLDDAAFRAVCGPLSRGVCRVEVRR